MGVIQERGERTHQRHACRQRTAIVGVRNTLAFFQGLAEHVAQLSGAMAAHQCGCACSFVQHDDAVDAMSVTKSVGKLAFGHVRAD